MQQHPADLVNQVNATHCPIIITQNGEPRAVLQDCESYENTRAALALLKLLAQAEGEVRNGLVTDQAQVFANLEALLS